jgi:hypothetical protein
MKKLKLLTVGLLMLFAFGTNAAESPVKASSDYEILAKCEISEPGFYAKGNCKKVLKAYRQWKQLKAQ